MTAQSRFQTGLLADVGGTYTRLAALTPAGEQHFIALRSNAEYSDPTALLRSYFAELPESFPPPTAAAIAVACPVLGDEVQMTNRLWSFSARSLAQDLQLRTLHVINDFTAVALSLRHLAPQDLVQIGGGVAVADAALAVLGPGTGLGVSGLVPHADGWVPLMAEGGHATLAAANEDEAEFVEWLRARHGHASAERALSGQGLVDLYRFVSATTDGRGATPEQVTELAINGEDTDASHALDLFFSLLGTTAGNLALTLGARGGVYLAGGILPRLKSLLANSPFRERFVAKGRFRSYLGAIPTFLIVDPYPAFKGLAATLLPDQ